LTGTARVHTGPTIDDACSRHRIVAALRTNVAAAESGAA
jgi:hypothetical protein